MPRLKKRSDGRFCRTYVDKKTKKRVYIYGETEREVNRKIAALQEKDNEAVTFSEIAEEWWDGVQDQIASQTRKNYKPHYERAVAEFGKTPLSEIAPLDVQDYLKCLARQGFAQKTVICARLVLNLIMKHGILAGAIKYNPCADIPIPRGLEKKKRPAADATDEQKILASDNTWLFPKIALLTGMRKGEILALLWEDVDFKNNVIHVTKSVFHEGDRPYIKKPKTESGTRIVPIIPALREILIERQGDPKEYIISDDGKKPLTNRRYITNFKQYQKDVGISCTAHQLRKSFTTKAVQADVSPKVLSSILGHAQISTTMDVYASVRTAALSRAAEEINSVFSEDK